MTTTANSSAVVGATCAGAADLARAAAGLPVTDVPGGEVDARVDVAHENGKKDQATRGKATDHWELSTKRADKGKPGARTDAIGDHHVTSGVNVGAAETQDDHLAGRKQSTHRLRSHTGVKAVRLDDAQLEYAVGQRHSPGYGQSGTTLDSDGDANQKNTSSDSTL